MNRDEIEAASPSLRNPQLEPADHVFVVLQDCGPNDGGWGPIAINLPWMEAPTPFVYTGDADFVLEAVARVVRAEAQRTGRPTRLVRYTGCENVYVVSGSS